MSRWKSPQIQGVNLYMCEPCILFSSWSLWYFTYFLANKLACHSSILSGRKHMTPGSNESQLNTHYIISGRNIGSFCTNFPSPVLPGWCKEASRSVHTPQGTLQKRKKPQSFMMFSEQACHYLSFPRWVNFFVPEGDTISIFQSCLLCKCPCKNHWAQRAVSTSVCNICRNVRDTWRIVS